jgi:hypothetical protein
MAGPGDRHRHVDPARIATPLQQRNFTSLSPFKSRPGRDSPFATEYTVQLHEKGRGHCRAEERAAENNDTSQTSIYGYQQGTAVISYRTGT